MFYYTINLIVNKGENYMCYTVFVCLCKYVKSCKIMSVHPGRSHKVAIPKVVLLWKHAWIV